LFYIQSQNNKNKIKGGFFNNFGLDMSSGLNLLLRALVREGNITFAVEERPSDEYVAWMKAELQKSLINRQDPNRRV
jgi:antitoxin component of RelBE/YafQ-DinJ toxin-antitoxin module